jgi:hypothetical protein
MTPDSRLLYRKLLLNFVDRILIKTQTTISVTLVLIIRLPRPLSFMLERTLTVVLAVSGLRAMKTRALFYCLPAPR